jgi:hypothetical protein
MSGIKMVAEEPIEIMKQEEIEKEEIETHNEKSNEQDKQDIEEQKPSQSAEVKPEDVKDDSETDVEKKEDDPSKNTPGDDEDVTMTFPQRVSLSLFCFVDSIVVVLVSFEEVCQSVVHASCRRVLRKGLLVGQSPYLLFKCG